MYSYSRSVCLNHKPLPSCPSAQSIGNAKSGGHGMCDRGETVIYTGLCQRLGCEYGNQLYVSFGLVDRYDDPYGKRCY